MTQFEEILKGLTQTGIQFVLIGGLAARVQGSAYLTQDVDICYQRTAENLQRLVKFLKSVEAKLRVKDNPEGLKFMLDEKSLSMGMNFTFKTTLGDLDILGEVSGIGPYEKVKTLSETIELYDLKIEVLSVQGLILAKRAASRPKDLLHLKELEALQEIKSRREKDSKT